MYYLNSDVILVKNDFEKTIFIFHRKSKVKFIVNLDTFILLSYIYKKNGITKDKLEIKFGSSISSSIDLLFNNDIIVQNYQEKKWNVKVNRTRLCRIFIEITDKCNLRCPHCYGNFGIQNNSFLSTTSIIKLIKKSAKSGVYEFDITGGEPFLHDDINRILDCAYNHGMLVTIFTNLTVLTNEHINKLIEYRVKKINVSIDSMENIVHDNFRGIPGSLDKTLKNIGVLRSFGMGINVNLVIGEHNIMTLESTLNDLAKLNLSVVIDFISISGRANKNQQLFSENYKGLLDLIKEKSNFKSNNILGCGVGKRFIFVNSNGEITLCPSLSMFKFGNISNKYSLRRLNNFMYKKYGDLICRSNCESKNECNGGCRARALSSNGSLYSHDELYCNLFRRNYEVE